MNVARQTFKEGKEFFTAEQTLIELTNIYGTASDDPDAKSQLPESIVAMLDKPLAMEALGGMLFYTRSLNLDKDLFSQRNFNIYDPIREGKNLVLDGLTLGHMEVSANIIMRWKTVDGPGAAQQ